MFAILQNNIIDSSSNTKINCLNCTIIQQLVEKSHVYENYGIYLKKKKKQVQTPLKKWVTDAVIHFHFSG